MQTKVTCQRTLWRGGISVPGTRVLAEECAIAISYNGSTHAVLMATPADLEDLAVGFSVSEGIIEDLSAIDEIAVVGHDLGLDVQVRVRNEIAERLAKRRRTMAGPVGCGMCGLESLEAAARPIEPVTASVRFASSHITAAMRSLEGQQSLNASTFAVHAAGFFRPGEPVSLVREDVGRHNALDKLIGAMCRSGVPTSQGGIVLTSRISVELVQKAAVVGVGLLAAVSAPTVLAVRTAAEAGVTLAAVVRGDVFECFTRTDRIEPEPVADVA